jgi:AcrR family transcriptional regulator
MARNDASIFFRELEPGWESDPRSSGSAQRERMLEAMSRAVEEKGYAKVTVADVVRLARVSRSTFYEQFADKEECFLATYEAGAQALMETVAERVRREGGEDWHDRIRVGLTCYTELLASDPALARTLLVDVLGAGPRAVQLRRRVFGGFVDLWRPSPKGKRPADVALRQVPDEFLRALVGGIGELVFEHIVTHGAESLPELAPTLIGLSFTVVAVSDQIGAPNSAVASA